MSLSNFLRTQRNAILDEWEAFARAVHSAHGFDPVELRDHAGGILDTIADDLEQAQSPSEQTEKAKGHAPADLFTQASLHGATRLAEGFTVVDAMSEFRALRASVLRLWSKSEPGLLHGLSVELTRFNEAIDQALTESLARYPFERARQSRLYDTLLAASPDLHYIFDLQGQLVYANQALAQLHGVNAGALVSMRLDELFPHAPPEFEQQFQLAARNGTTTRSEMAQLRPDGTLIHYEYLFLPVRYNDQVEAVAGTARDITERKVAEERIQRSATYDALTELPNRSLFRDRLEQAVRHAARTSLPIAVLFIDLDGFKGVNDRFGHAAGDGLLQLAARRIQACVRDSDTVARVGGDEFTVLLADVRRTGHLEILAQQLLAQLATPFTLALQDVHISASIGISLCPQDAATPDELVRNADQAMYVAKNAGRNRFSFFTSTMRDSAWARLKVIEELRHALPLRQLVVLYQPVIELASGRIVRAQALVRWQHPHSGLMVPAQFLPLAEESGMIVAIDEWVLAEASAQSTVWARQSGQPFSVSVHRSPAEFSAKTPAANWGQSLFALDDARSGIAIGMDEQVLISNDSAVLEKLHYLEQLGMNLVVDNFGASYASPTYLKRFKIDCVKLDQSLIRAGPASAELLRSIIVMAHALGLKTIADGVEHPEQRDWLTEAGCDYAQGFLFSGPLTAQGMGELLAHALT